MPRLTARDLYRDGFLTIESGKTLTFIVGEFLNDLARRGGQDRLGREVERKCGFRGWIFTIRFKRAEMPRNFSVG